MLEALGVAFVWLLSGAVILVALFLLYALSAALPAARHPDPGTALPYRYSYEDNRRELRRLARNSKRVFFSTF